VRKCVEDGLPVAPAAVLGNAVDFVHSVRIATTTAIRETQLAEPSVRQQTDSSPAPDNRPSIRSSCALCNILEITLAATLRPVRTSTAGD
jgi:hypothetical protein